MSLHWWLVSTWFGHIRSSVTAGVPVITCDYMCQVSHMLWGPSQSILCGIDHIIHAAIGQPSGPGILLCSQKIKQVSLSHNLRFWTGQICDSYYTASKAIWRMRIFIIFDISKALTWPNVHITVIMTPSAVLITPEAGLMSLLMHLSEIMQMYLHYTNESSGHSWECV